VSRGQVEHVAKTALTGNFFTVDLDSVRNAFERLPWVRRAEVRRVWPDGLELALEEHVAVARWQHAEGEPTLVNSHGEVFVALAPANARLPSFTGPDGSSARMLARYREVEKALSPLGRKTASMVLSSREAWEVRLDDGIVVALGRDQAKLGSVDRLARLTDHYPAVRERLRGAGGVIDMRYPNGFALRPGRGERNS
jgi:cell division protein FtsQ